MKKCYEKKVKDIMIPFYDFPTVSADATLKDVLMVMMNSYNYQNKPRTGRNCVFVVEDNELVGIFGIPELMEAIKPQYLRNTFINVKGYNFWTSAIPFFWNGLFTDRCKEIADEKVRDYMQTIENHVNVNDTLLKAAYSMVKNKAEAVAVKDNERLVGMIRSVDIFQEIANLVFNYDYNYHNRNQPAINNWAGGFNYTQSNG